MEDVQGGTLVEDVSTTDLTPSTESVPGPEAAPPQPEAQVTLLTKDAILSADDTQMELVEVPEWGGSVWIRGLTGADRDMFEESMLSQRKKGQKREVNFVNFRAKLVTRAVVTGPEIDAPLMFSPEDIKALGNKSGRALQRVFKVAQDLSGLSADDVDELTEELGEDESADSGSN